MNEREYKAEIEALKQRIVELEMTKIKPPVPPHPKWRPIFNENYYFIYYEEEIHEHIWVEDKCDIALYSKGNVFKTKEEANFAIERLKVLAEMREWAGSWDDTFALTYIGNGDFVQISNVLMSRNTFGEMRFATREDAENCIKAVGEDRIKKYYFMIPEDKSND